MKNCTCPGTKWFSFQAANVFSSGDLLKQARFPTREFILTDKQLYIILEKKNLFIKQRKQKWEGGGKNPFNALFPKRVFQKVQNYLLGCIESGVLYRHFQRVRGKCGHWNLCHWQLTWFLFFFFNLDPSPPCRGDNNGVHCASYAAAEIWLDPTEANRSRWVNNATLSFPEVSVCTGGLRDRCAEVRLRF